MAVSTLSFRKYLSTLSGRQLGAFKTAAAKIGVTLEEYTCKVESGLKWCIDCKRWKNRTAFKADKSRWDGCSAKCIECNSIRGKESHDVVALELMRPKGPARKPLIGDDRKRARRLVNVEVRTGRRPNPNDLHCVKCGHKGPDRRHEYHHHCGYAPERVFDVMPLCSKCHGREHRKNGT